MRLDNVQLRYSRRGPWVLTGVDATLDAGDAIVILGRNGAGKSTLLQVIAGVLAPSRGTVRDRPASVGWVPERFPADQPFTIRTYLRSMAAIRGLSSANGVIESWAERLGFERYLDERLSALSKGTAQKVGLAQALLVRPQLLVLDEPWEGLDAQTRDEVPAIVSEIVEAGGSVAISDHHGDMGLLSGVVAWLLEDGRLHPAAEPVRASSAVPNGAPLWASPTMLTHTVTPSTAGQPASAAAASQPVAGGTPRWIVEVEVAAADRAAAAARLQATGHLVRGVREEVG